MTSVMPVSLPASSVVTGETEDVVISCPFWSQMDVLAPTYRCFPCMIAVDGRDRSAFRIIGSRWRDSRYCATSPLRRGAMRCRLDRRGRNATWSARSPDNAMRMPQRTDDGFLAYSFVECTHRYGYAAIKKLDNRNGQSLGYICAIVSPMIRMPVSMSAASGAQS